MNTSTVPAAVAAALPTDALLALLDAAERQGLDGALTAAVAARVAARAGEVGDVAQYARVAVWHAAVSARRSAEAAARREARAAAEAAAEFAEIARINRLREEFITALARVPNAKRERGLMALHRKFDGWGDEQLAAAFGGPSRACRDQWVRRGTKAVLAVGVSAELEAHVTYG